jgi:hypothetical protein
VKCYVCDKRIRKSQAYVEDEDARLKGKHLCEDCYYEPAVTVLYGKDEEN